MTDDYEEGRQRSADPFQIARMFFTALEWYPDSSGEFQFLMTPEALALDGAIDLAAALMRSLDEPQMSAKPLYFEGDPHVSYVVVGQKAAARGTAPSGGTFDDLLFITLVWRPEVGGWAVHHFGDMVHPQDVPRGA